MNTIPMLLLCPQCKVPHIDEGEWATKPHKTHQCQHCKAEWRPFVFETVGVADPLSATILPDKLSNLHPTFGRIVESFNGAAQERRYGPPGPEGHRVMTRLEYGAFDLKGWHQVCHNADSAGNTEIRYGSPDVRPSYTLEGDEQEWRRHEAEKGLRLLSDDDLWHIAGVVSSLNGGSLYNVSQHECVTVIRAAFMEPDAGLAFAKAQASLIQMLTFDNGVQLPIVKDGDGFKIHPDYLAVKQEPAPSVPAADLYVALRNMNWTDGKLTVIEAKDLRLGVQTYSGELLDAAIIKATKEST